MSNTEFPKTFQALKNLQGLFSCKTCGMLADNPCTLGGCDHIFCNVCCDSHLEKNECPVCNIHVSVKDAQVNRQMFNLVKLCQRLEAVLTDQEDTVKSHTTDRTTACPGTTKKSFQETSYDCIENGNNRSSMKTKCSPLPCLDKKQSISNKRNENRRKRNLPADQKTMTQMFCTDDEDSEIDVDDNSESSDSLSETPKRKKKILTKSSGKNVTLTADQTTMSQFFDYVDESEDDDNDITDNQTTTVKMEKLDISKKNMNARNKKQKRDVPNVTKTKVVSRNLRTRSKENKSDANITPVSGRRTNRSAINKNDLTPSSVRNISMDDTTPSSNRKTGRTSRSGSRVQEIRENHQSGLSEENSRSRRSLSPCLQRSASSKVRLNSSFTGSGKKTTDPLMKRNAKGETPLQVAAIKGDVSKIKELLKAGASPNTRDNAGWTPLHEAVHHGYTEAAKLLIDHGAMINVPGTENDTPLHDAIRQGQLDCVKLLVSRGASLTSRNIHGCTPEDFAIREDMKAALSMNVVSTPQTTQEVDVLEYQPPCLLPTGLNREQKILLQKCAILIHGKVVEDFSPEVTHIVTTCNKDGMCARTFKYMHGVLNGKWIVNFDWVNMCIDFGSKVCEEAFEIPGSSQNTDSHAAEKGRTNRKNQLPKLFDGYQFYFHGNFEYPAPNKEDLIDLVKSGGGQILTREPKHLHSNTTDIPIVPYHAPADGPLSKCSVLVVNDNKEIYEHTESGVVCSVSFGWLLNCVGTFKIQQKVDV